MTGPKIFLFGLLAIIFFSLALIFSSSLYQCPCNPTNLPVVLKETIRNSPDQSFSHGAFKCFVDPREYLEKFKQESDDGYAVIRDIDFECAAATTEIIANCRVPKVVHLVIFGGTFKFYNYLSLKSINDKVKPDLLFIHGYDFPVGQELFDRALQEFSIILIESRKIKSIYHNKIDVVEHRSDVLRLENIIRYGGMYFDLDVITLKDMDPFLNNELTMGQQDSDGHFINNGVIIGKRCSRFLRYWYHQYHSFDDRQWADHSVELPGKIYDNFSTQDHLGLVLKGDELYNRHPCRILFKDYHNPVEWKSVRSVHTYYRGYGITHDFTDVKTLTNNFGKLARFLLYDGPAMDDYSTPDQYTPLVAFSEHLGGTGGGASQLCCPRKMKITKVSLARKDGLLNYIDATCEDGTFLGRAGARNVSNVVETTCDDGFEGVNVTYGRFVYSLVLICSGDAHQNSTSTSFDLSSAASTQYETKILLCSNKMKISGFDLSSGDKIDAISIACYENAPYRPYRLYN
jgi:hypothetical protein